MTHVFCFQPLTDFLTTHVPLTAVYYCHQLWQQYQFQFRVTKPRRTRLGDFRVLPSKKMQVTVNANLNPYAFLITYVHEVAHAAVYQQAGLGARNRRVKPHGLPWQTAFQQLMQPLLSEAVFPAEVLQPLRQYLTKPAATTYASPTLMAALRQFDVYHKDIVDSNKLLLHQVPEGKTFLFAQKMYMRGTLRRTRIVCKEIISGKSYAILAHAWVEINEE